MGERLHYSFVVDCHGPFAYQGYILARSLLEFGGASPTQITVNIVKGTEPAMVEPFLDLQLNVAAITPFPGHPYCNKIKQIASVVDAEADTIVLLDSDFFVLRPLVFNGPTGIRGKIVDRPNPPAPVLERIYKRAGVRLTLATVDLGLETTAAANFNGGLYVVPRQWLGPLHDGWLRWAHWCLSNIHLFERWAVHVDQVSFALAVTELGLPVLGLDRRYNCPTHLGNVAAMREPPIALHYHRHVDDNFLLRMTGSEVLDEAITAANAALARWRSDRFPVALLRSASTMRPLGSS